MHVLLGKFCYFSLQFYSCLFKINSIVRFFLCLFIFVICNTHTLFAQEKNIYIADYEQKLILSVFTAKEFLNITVEDKNQDLMYMPNNPVELGLGFSWKNSVFSFAYGYGFDFMRDKKLGKTKSFDLQFHHYNRRFVLDFFLQRYKGFYMEDEKNEIKNVLAPDLELRQYGIYGQYIFNHKKLSYKAAYIHNEKQLRSAGSLLAGGGIYFSRIRSDSSFVYKELDNFQFGASIGYTYTWVINKRWFMNGTITTGINFGCENFSKLGKQKLEVSPTVFPRISIGYDHDSWSLGLTYLSNMTFPVFSDDIQMGLLSGQFLLSYYRRINDVPVLSRLIK